MTFNITNLISRKKSLKNVNANDLNKERINLENEERKIEKSVARLHKDDQQLLSEYAAAKSSNDKHQQSMLARKIQEVRHRMQSQDTRHCLITKHMRTVNGLMVLKENEAFFKRIGANSVINNMDMVELQSYVEQATADGELTSEKLESLVATMDEASQVMMEGDGDSGLENFMAGLDNEVAGTVEAIADTRGNQELDSAIDVLDREIARNQTGVEAVSDSNNKAQVS